MGNPDYGEGKYGYAYVWRPDTAKDRRYMGPNKPLVSMDIRNAKVEYYPNLKTAADVNLLDRTVIAICCLGSSQSATAGHKLWRFTETLEDGRCIPPEVYYPMLHKQYVAWRDRHIKPDAGGNGKDLEIEDFMAWWDARKRAEVVH